MVASRADDGTTALTVQWKSRDLSHATATLMLTEWLLLQACDLSEDQTPYRQDERERVKAKGKAKVCSANQVTCCNDKHMPHRHEHVDVRR